MPMIMDIIKNFDLPAQSISGTEYKFHSAIKMMRSARPNKAEAHENADIIHPACVPKIGEKLRQLGETKEDFMGPRPLTSFILVNEVELTNYKKSWFKKIKQKIHMNPQKRLGSTNEFKNGDRNCKKRVIEDEKNLFSPSNIDGSCIDSPRNVENIRKTYFYEPAISDIDKNEIVKSFHNPPRNGNSVIENDKAVFKVSSFEEKSRIKLLNKLKTCVVRLEIFLDEESIGAKQCIISLEKLIRGFY